MVRDRGDVMYTACLSALRQRTEDSDEKEISGISALSAPGGDPPGSEKTGDSGPGRREADSFPASEKEKVWSAVFLYLVSGTCQLSVSKIEV